VIRSCSKCVILLLIFMYFVLFSLITSPVLSAACLIYYCSFNRSHRLSRYQHIICKYNILSGSVKNWPVQIGLYIPCHLLKYNNQHRCSLCIILPHGSPYARYLSIVLGFSLFRLISATQFLLSSIISSGPQIPLKFLINVSYWLSHGPA